MFINIFLLRFLDRRFMDRRFLDSRGWDRDGQLNILPFLFQVSKRVSPSSVQSISSKNNMSIDFILNAEPLLDNGNHLQFKFR